MPSAGTANPAPPRQGQALRTAGALPFTPGSLRPSWGHNGRPAHVETHQTGSGTGVARHFRYLIGPNRQGILCFRPKALPTPCAKAGGAGPRCGVVRPGASSSIPAPAVFPKHTKKQRAGIEPGLGMVGVPGSNPAPGVFPPLGALWVQCQKTADPGIEPGTLTPKHL